MSAIVRHGARGLAVAACLGLVVSASMANPAPAVAADGLVLSSYTTYDVRPNDRRVQVSVDVSATNVVRDTAEGRTYFTGLSIPIPPTAVGVSAFGGGVPLAVSLSTADPEVSVAEIRFSTNVFYQQTYRFRLSFAIADAGGDPTRETWVRSSFVAFPVWAFASDGPTTVEVVLPAGFTATDPRDEFVVSHAEGSTRLKATDVDPLEFGAYVTAERAGDRASTRLEVAFAESTGRIELLAWGDDPEWADRMAGYLLGGFPLLEEEIGLPYAFPSRLHVKEHAYQHLGDYGGYFSWAEGAINIRFDADAYLALHEASHLWFNEGLTDERWVNEGFASYYAELVGHRMGETIDVAEMTDAIAEHAFPLTEWAEPFVEDLEREDYGYAAALAVAREIAELVGADGLRAVWQAVSDERRAYALEPDEVLADGQHRMHRWQRYLDLFEIETGADLAGVWLEWIVDDDAADELETRAAAREAYAATTDDLRDWPMPESTRMAMEWWDFVDATAQLDAIGEVVELRAVIAADAAALDLEPTDDLRQALENEGIDAAAAEADEQLGALAAIADSTSTVGAELTFFETIGLVGEVEPTTHLVAARSAYEAGDDEAAGEAAANASSARGAAEDRGRTRVVAGGVASVGVVGGIGLVVAVRRRQGRQPELDA